MRVLNPLSLRRKQALIITLTSSVVLLLACGALITYDTIAFRQGMIRNVSVLADAIGNNCAAALDFDDPGSADETLAALRANDNVALACVYTMEGGVFAVYERKGAVRVDPPAVSWAASAAFAEGQLQLFRPIRQRGELIGMIFVASHLDELRARLRHYGIMMGLVFLGSLGLAYLLSNQLQWLISGPILELARVVRSVALERDYSVRAKPRSGDELGQLVEGFNEMLAQIQVRDTALLEARHRLEERVRERTEELEMTHEKLVGISRAAGMAEIASNVLHNVGNVLNSVNISAGVVMGSIRDSKVASLGQVVRLLREHHNDVGSFMQEDPKGRQLPDYLAQLSEFLIGEQASTLKELELLRENVEHIKEIVAMQQSYSKVSAVEEVADVRELVEDSLRMNAGSMSRHGVTVIREYEAVPPMMIEKHKTLQILVNLVRNARHACDESGRTDKRVTVRVASAASRVRISVADNGVGIPAENLMRIFNHGFTTRKNGHGYGLHSGALAAKEMGGALTVNSAGPGCGATFTLELPAGDKS
jgi:two-component system, NtrC family, sensor kinase